MKSKKIKPDFTMPVIMQETLRGTLDITIINKENVTARFEHTFVNRFIITCSLGGYRCCIRGFYSSYLPPIDREVFLFFVKRYYSNLFKNGDILKYTNLDYEQELSENRLSIINISNINISNFLKREERER